MQSRVWGVVNASAPEATAIETSLQAYAGNTGGSAGTRAEARAAVQTIMRARQLPLARPPFPTYQTLGRVALPVTAFAIGWKIGRMIDTKWLHLSGDVGTWTGGPLIAPGQMSWKPWTVIGPGPGTPAGWYLTQEAPYWAPYGREIAIDPSTCTAPAAYCYGWSDYRGTTSQKKQVNAELFQYLASFATPGHLVAWGYNLNGALCGGNNSDWGRALVCYARYLTSPEMGNRLYLDQPTTDFSTQQYDFTSAITAPQMPAWDSPDWNAIVAGIKEDPNLEDAINHELDDTMAPDPFGDGGGDKGSGTVTSEFAHECDWDDAIRQELWDWQTMMSHLAPEDAAFYQEECDKAWEIWEQSGGLAGPKGQNAIAIRAGRNIDNPQVIDALQARGGVTDWAKVSIRERLLTPRGNPYEVHWYERVTSPRPRETYLGHDYRVIFKTYFLP